MLPGVASVRCLSPLHRKYLTAVGALELIGECHWSALPAQSRCVVACDPHVAPATRPVGGLPWHIHGLGMVADQLPGDAQCLTDLRVRYPRTKLYQPAYLFSRCHGFP